MTFGQIITGSILLLATIALGVYVSFTARCKGLILSNSYIFASKEARKKMDVTAEYMLITKVFSCITVIFALMSLHVFTGWQWAYSLIWPLTVGVVIYAIVDAIRTFPKSQK